MENKSSPIIKICSFIVDKRNLFFLIYLILVIFSLFSSKWVSVENDLSAYLSEDTETRQGLDLMDSEYTTFGSAKVMVSNIMKKISMTLLLKTIHPICLQILI